MQLNLERFRAADSARFSNAWDVSRNLSKDVKTTCGFVNMAKKAEIARRKLEKKGCIPPQVGVCGCRNFQQFCFFIHILATDMLESHSRALKTRILPSFRKKLEPK